MRTTALVWDDALAGYRFRPGHPLNPRRLELTVSLIRRLGLVGDGARPVVAPRQATDAELELVHAPDYVAAVKRAGRRAAAAAEPGPGGVLPVVDADGGIPERYGMGTADVPVVAGMHEMSAWVVGSTLVAAETVMSGRAERAFSVAGGLHHAMRAEASGFCVYNDLAVAIEWLKREHGARVLYIDYDAHHGDGVQSIFYEDPEVLTFSIHESGRYLFPASGFIDELGAGDGHGYSVNVPLEPDTGDASFLAACDMLLPELAEAFRPDVVVLQNGCDSHALDPLTHLRCTTRLGERVVRLVSDIADRHCGGRIVATGGGGYAIHAVVPRAWTLVWAALCGEDVADEIPDDWLDPVRREASPAVVPGTLRDPPGEGEPAATAAANDRTARTVRRKVIPLLTGWGLGF